MIVTLNEIYMSISMSANSVSANIDFQEIFQHRKSTDKVNGAFTACFPGS